VCFFPGRRIDGGRGGCHSAGRINRMVTSANKTLRGERRFLLRELPEGLAAGSAEVLHLGCLSAGGNREVFVGRRGRERFLLEREGRMRLRRESEVALGARGFEDLWRLTEGSRIVKTTRAARVEGLDFRVERIERGGEGISIAAVGFPGPAAAAAFVPPAFLGVEITGMEEFSDAHLALHGLPPARNGRAQAGALPFLFKNGILHLVLVTSSSGQRWIVPKGGLEKGMTRQEVALMEAAEEAGAIGTIEPGIKTQCRMDDRRVLHLYPLRVATLLPHWPERAMRRRVVLPVYRALMRVREDGVAQAIRRLGRQLEP
jgi:8-oxo-dGTP pyrophosphatase MutT (NUDIX family)